MTIILNEHPDKTKLEQLLSYIASRGASASLCEGCGDRFIKVEGDISRIDTKFVLSHEIVLDVKKDELPFPLASRKNHPENTIINIGGAEIGNGGLALIAGPCSVESEDQLLDIAQSIKKSGATFLRGGAYKPRNSPYSFQGLGEEGIRLLLKAKKLTGLPIVTEIVDVRHLPFFEDVDVIQVGAKNMQNFELLKELGKIDKPVLIKRGVSATYEELLMSAEFVLSGGNKRVILCERGIRTFESRTRNTLDLSAVPILKKLSHLPVLVDPSHSTGRADLVAPMSLAAAAAGADGLLIEVHNDPPSALCDGFQSIMPEEFEILSKKLKAITDILR